MITLKKVHDDFSTRMDGLLKKATGFQGAAARIYPVYQKLQTERFKTEGASEGYPWEQPKEPYRTYKTKRFGGGSKSDGTSWRSFPGSGRKTMIATSTLAGAVIGPGSPFVSEGINKHRALFTNKSMEIYVEQSGVNADGRPFNYASYANESRPLMKFSKTSIDLLKTELKKFLFE